MSVGAVSSSYGNFYNDIPGADALGLVSAGSSSGSTGTVGGSNDYSDIPGADALGLNTTAQATSSAGTSSDPSTSSTTTPSVTNQYTDIPGADALGLTGDPSLAPTTSTASSNSSVAGFDALGIQGNGQAASTTSTASTTANTGATSNPYQSAYEGIIQASDAYLAQSAENPDPTASIPLYAGGSSASQFAALSNTLSAIATGQQNGLFQGTGVNNLA